MTKKKLKAPVKKNIPEPKPTPVYIVVYRIKEDGKLYVPGNEYSGKFVERFLKHGQIRIKG